MDDKENGKTVATVALTVDEMQVLAHVINNAQGPLAWAEHVVNVKKKLLSAYNRATGKEEASE